MIILQFDNVYHHWGLLALQSLQLHERHTPVLCDTVNLTDRQVAELERAHGQVVVTNDTSTSSKTTPEQMAFRKPFVMQHAMQRYPREPWYGLFDADLLIRKPLGPLWSLMDNHPAAVIISDGMWDGKFYRRLVAVSGIVLVRPDARRLIDCWAKWYYHDQPLDSLEPLIWLWDQITLLEALTEAGVPYANIPLNVYFDAGLRPSATIWSANVPEKKEFYELFRKEYHRQRARLTGCGPTR